jgi:hypothetical protein
MLFARRDIMMLQTPIMYRSWSRLQATHGENEGYSVSRAGSGCNRSSTI